MALKAGLVGVNPKGVDKNGMPISSAGNAVDEAQLTANGKQFHFAYDETSEKYGYKLDGAGDFIPFESAGGGPGWVAPAELITTGLTVNQFIEIISGGYYDDGTNIFVDIIVKQISAGTGRIMGLAKAPSSTLLIAFKDAELTNISDLYLFDGTHTNTSVTTVVEGSSSYINLQSNQGIDNYLHIFGAYKKA